MQFRSFKSQQGAAALLTIIIIASVTLIMAFNSSLLGLGELDLGYIAQKNSETLSVADGCFEESLRRLRLDQNYSGGVLNLGAGSCIINVVALGNNRTITVTSTVDIYYKTIRAEVSLIGSNITINSWQEISN